MTVKKKKVGIVTWLGFGNFGTALQAYALYFTINKLGYECFFLHEFKYKLPELKKICKIIIKRIRGKRHKGTISYNKESLPIKQQKLFKFFDDNIKQIYIHSKKEYEQLLRDTNVFCAGSDQIWNAYYEFSPFRFLEFAKNVKRISYASSIGTKDIPRKFCKPIKKLLKRFDHISLREDIGCEVIARLTGRKDIKHVLDPTFLLRSNDWDVIAKQADLNINVPNKYILCYFIGNQECYKEQLKQVKMKSNILNIVIIPSEEYPNFMVGGALVCKDAAISEFIYLIQHAALVCTDSFHATAISINFCKSFVEFLRFTDSDKNSQNSRIYDLLNMFGLRERLYSDDNAKWTEPIDYKKVNSTLEVLRKDSIDYLKRSIDN